MAAIFVYIEPEFTAESAEKSVKRTRDADYFAHFYTPTTTTTENYLLSVEKIKIIKVSKQLLAWFYPKL